jgi:methyl-accepting chemotaxis protein
MIKHLPGSPEASPSKASFLRIRRGDFKLPRARDFRPSRPHNWTIRTRLIVASISPVALVAILELVGGHLGPLTLVVLAAGCVFAILVGRSVTKRIEVVIDSATRGAVGDLSQEEGQETVVATGELGRLVDAFAGIRMYMEELAALADRVAAGDLTREVQTRSDQDGLAQAFRYMITRLRKMVTELAKAADSVAETASQVNEAAAQSETNATQIAQTIGHVAAGAADQAHASTDTSMAMMELGQVIEQGGSGAAQTAESVGAQADATRSPTRRTCSPSTRPSKRPEPASKATASPSWRTRSASSPSGHGRPRRRSPRSLPRSRRGPPRPSPQ